MKIFILEYIMGDRDSVENWGVYSTLERAKEVQNALCNLKDYNFFLESFEIQPWEIDRLPVQLQKPKKLEST